MVQNTNDGSAAQPSLRIDISWGNLNGLPAYYPTPQGNDRELHEAAKAAGFMGIQDGDPELCASLGLAYGMSGRASVIGEAKVLAERARRKNADCVTLHVGWGIESEDETYALVEDVLKASEAVNIPLYIETHRATITQDMWRTVQIAHKFPEVRFNGDFSHWYTGQEMVYGNIEHKWEFLAPVFERVRYLHGRIGNPGNIQVDVGDGHDLSYVEHFKEMWTRSFRGFLATACPGDYFCFTPELLGPPSYARLFKNAAGQEVEEGNRWQQALLYAEIARACFTAAKHESV